MFRAAPTRKMNQGMWHPLDLLLLLLSLAALLMPGRVLAMDSPRPTPPTQSGRPSPQPPQPKPSPVNVTTPTKGPSSAVSLEGSLIYRSIAPVGIWLLSSKDGKNIILLPQQPIDAESNVPIEPGNVVSLTCILSSPLTNECTQIVHAKNTRLSSSAANTVNVTLRLLVVIVDMVANNSCDDIISNQPVLKETELNKTFLGANGIVDFFSECSYGRMSIDRNTLKVVSVDLPCSEILLRPCWDWAMPINLSGSVKGQLLEYGIRQESFSHIFYVIPNNTLHPCSWRGLADLPGTESWFTREPKGIFGKGTVMQELLHNYGMYHGYDNDDREYEDYSTAMGRGDSCPSAPELWRLGWAEPLVELNSTSLPAATFKTFNLRATYLGPEGAMIKIKPDWLGKDYIKNLYLALRMKAGGDRDLLDQFDGKLSIHRVKKEYDVKFTIGANPRISLIIGDVSPNSSFSLSDYKLQILTGDLTAQNSSIVVKICRYNNSLIECSGIYSQPPQSPAPPSPRPPPSPRQSPSPSIPVSKLPPPPPPGPHKSQPPPPPLLSPPLLSKPPPPKPSPSKPSPPKPPTPPSPRIPPAPTPRPQSPTKVPSPPPRPRNPTPIEGNKTCTSKGGYLNCQGATVEAGFDFTCVLTTDGTIKCFGANAHGQLGLGDIFPRGDKPGTMGSNLPFVDLGPNLEVTAIAAGGYHACALLQPGGIIKCWGDNSYGQLGLGDTNNRGDDPGEMGSKLIALDMGANLTATSITAGASHTCALLQPGGIIKCWGSNNYGQLGLGDTASRGDQRGEMGSSLPAVNLGPGLSATSITAGHYHTCALLQPGGIIKCWGWNAWGQLGIGNYNNRGGSEGQMGGSLPAVSIGPGYNATTIAAGFAFTCALLHPGGVIKCWGLNSPYGELGQGNTDTYPDPSILDPIDLGHGYTATAVTTGGAYACALLNPGGSIKCWGVNSYGELGLGDTNNRGDQPNEMGDRLPSVNLGPFFTAIGINAGYDHTCALLQPGKILKCWGSNFQGELGLQDVTNRGGRNSDMGVNLPSVALW